MTCNIFYEDWQIQCCGQPFKVGEIVHWTGERDESDIKEYHIDFCEDHHCHHSLHIEGKVSRILSVTSEEDATKHNYSFDEADYIFTDLQEADGWESEKESTDEIYYIFWGYIVTLDDVKITEEAPHRLTMLPDIDQIFMNEDGGSLSADKDGKIDDIYDKNGQAIIMKELKEWAEELYPIIISSETGETYSKDWDDYHKRGLAIAHKLREILSPDFDLWYEIPEEDKTTPYPTSYFIENK